MRSSRTLPRLCPNPAAVGSSELGRRQPFPYPALLNANPHPDRGPCPCRRLYPPRLSLPSAANNVGSSSRQLSNTSKVTCPPLPHSVPPVPAHVPHGASRPSSGSASPLRTCSLETTLLLDLWFPRTKQSILNVVAWHIPRPERANFLLSSTCFSSNACALSNPLPPLSLHKCVVNQTQGLDTRSCVTADVPNSEHMESMLPSQSTKRYFH